MERLPLELHEQIFGYLLSLPGDWTNMVAVPVSTKTERADIYNLRLTSRRISRAALLPFAQIIGDIPTMCVENSLRCLTNLMASEEVSATIISLTFNTCKLVVTEKQTLSQLNLRCQHHNEWIKHEFHDQTLAILRKASQLRHLVCFLEAMRGSEILGFGGGQIVALERNVRNLTDPALYIQRAIKMARINNTLETMTILNTSFEGFSELGPLREDSSPVEYSMLKHLTLSPSCSELSQVRVFCPHLTSLHLVLDNRGDGFDTGSTEGLPFDAIHSGLQSMILSGKGQHVNTALLLQCIVPATTNIPSLPLLTIRDMIIIMDINYGVERLPGEGQFKELRLENLKLCFTDEITLSGPSEPIKLGSKWKALPRLCERADVVRLSTDGLNKIMEAMEWEESDESS